MTTACSCRWLHTIVVYDPTCPLHARPAAQTSGADCAHVWDRVLTQEGTPTQRQCQRCGIIESGGTEQVCPDEKTRMATLSADLYKALLKDVGANEDALVLDGIEAFVLMVSVIAAETVTRSFAQIAEDELVKLRERVATSART